MKNEKETGVGIPVVSNRGDSKQYSSTKDEERTLWFLFGASEGGYGAYLHNSTNNNMLVDYVKIESEKDTRVELHIVEGQAVGSVLSIAIDPSEEGYVHPVTAYSERVTGVESSAHLDTMFVASRGRGKTQIGGGVILSPGGAIAVKSNNGFEKGMIQAVIIGYCCDDI